MLQRNYFDKSKIFNYNKPTHRKQAVGFNHQQYFFMKEVEVKAQVKNLSAIKEACQKLGARWSLSCLQQDVLFLHSELEFKDIQKDTPVLRIRTQGERVYLTLKKRSGTALVKIEEEMVVSDAMTAERILTHMGYHEVLRLSKKREEGVLGDITICLDEVEGLGAFIEVEKLIAEDADSVAPQQELWNFLQSLGLSEADRVFQGYDTLVYQKSQ